MYTRVNWKNNEDGGTPMNAANLNVMDAGIKTLDTNYSALKNEVETQYASVMYVEGQVSDKVTETAMEQYVDGKIGTIGSALDAINGKVV